MDNEIVLSADWLLPEEWGTVDPASLQKSVIRGSTKNAIYTHIPSVCKGTSCLFHKVCWEWEHGEVQVGQRCVPEMASIINLGKDYISGMNIGKDNFIDRYIIKDLILCDIMIERCTKVLASEDMFGDVDKAINSKGEVITEAAEHIALSILDKWTNKRFRILNELNETPKARTKNGLAGKNMDISKVLCDANREKEALEKEE